MAAKNNKKLRKVAQIQKEKAINFSSLEKFVLNVERDSDQERPHVNLKYYHPEYECFSEWASGEMKAFSAFIDKLRKTTWQDIHKTGGKLGNKTSFGYTQCTNPKKLPQNPALTEVSEDITFFELRVDNTMRVHGFRCLDAFYLVWLDRSHRMYG